MSTTIVLQGVVKPDGRLELAGNTQLPQGPVEVTVRPMTPLASRGEDWWQYLQRARRELEALNYPFLTEQEVTAYIEGLRADDDRIEEAYRQANKSSRE